MKGYYCLLLFLVFATLNERVFADCSDSLICGEETIEILLITAVIAVCVLFLVQCIIIACLARKLIMFKKRMERMRLSRGSYTYHTTFPHLSPSEIGAGESEDITFVPDSRESRNFSTGFTDTKRRSLITNLYTTGMELTIVDNPDTNRNKEIWNLN